MAPNAVHADSWPVRLPWLVPDLTALPPGLQVQVQAEVSKLHVLEQGWRQPVITVASFGLVSRGKSAVCNGLLGEKRLNTGAVHGVTRWPRTVRWHNAHPAGFAVDLVDTPGLDEVAGDDRAAMAGAIVSEADLLLFVINGRLTPTELKALGDLWGQKPLFLVFNKIDLYPDDDRPRILAQIQDQVRQHLNLDPQTPLTLLPVAAEPLPRAIQVEWPDGTVTEDWSRPDPDLQALNDRLNTFFHTEALHHHRQHLIAQAQPLIQTLVNTTLTFHEASANTLQQRFLRGRSLWVMVSPWPLLDVLGAFGWDLWYTRNLAKIYQLPLTSQAVSPLWQTMINNLVLLLVGEWGGAWLWGSDLSLWSHVTFSPLGVGASLVAQGIWAAYGSYQINQAARRYLSQSWAGVERPQVNPPGSPPDLAPGESNLLDSTEIDSRNNPV